MLENNPAFNKNLYLERRDIYQMLDDWLQNRQAKKRVRVLIGPPGMGKSWVLEGYKNHIAECLPHVYPVWLYLPGLLNGNDFNPNSDKVRRLLGEELGKIPPKDAIPFHVNPLTDTTKAIEYKAEAYANNLPENLILLIVDGYDELSRYQRSMADERILYPFVSQISGRLLAGFRSECKFESYVLRRLKDDNDILLPPFAPLNDVHEQFEKLIEEKYPGVFNKWWPLCDEWLRELHIYQWNHPCANRILLVKAFIDHKSKPRSLSGQDIEDCVLEIINRPPPSPTKALESNDFLILLHLAHNLIDTWTGDDLCNALGLGSFKAWQKIQPLMDRGVIENISNSQRFKVVDGILQLLRELIFLKYPTGTLPLPTL